LVCRSRPAPRLLWNLSGRTYGHKIHAQPPHTSWKTHLNLHRVFFNLSNLHGLCLDLLTRFFVNGIRFLKVGATSNSEFYDARWFMAHIFFFNFACDNESSRRIVNQIQLWSGCNLLVGVHLALSERSDLLVFETFTVKVVSAIILKLHNRMNRAYQYQRYGSRNSLQSVSAVRL
jgi:hypothetical protein